MTQQDLDALQRITNQLQEIVNSVRADKRDLVEYGLALAMAARNVHRTIKKFGGPDAELYDRLGKLLQEMDGAP